MLLHAVRYKGHPRLERVRRSFDFRLSQSHRYSLHRVPLPCALIILSHVLCVERKTIWLPYVVVGPAVKCTGVGAVIVRSRHAAALSQIVLRKGHGVVGASQRLVMAKTHAEDTVPCISAMQSCANPAASQVCTCQIGSRLRAASLGQFTPYFCAIPSSNISSAFTAGVRGLTSMMTLVFLPRL